MMSDIFVSYAKSDIKEAKSFIKQLETEGYSVWWGKKLIPGKSLQHQIDEQLNNAKVVIVLWISDAVDDDALSVANKAFAEEKLLPLFSNEVDISKLPVPHNELYTLSINEVEAIREVLSQHGAKPIGNPWKPIIIDEFTRLKKYDVAGGLAMDCDYAEGRFSRDKYWNFEIYFDDEISNMTFLNTRLSEFYIKCDGLIQWSWSAGNDDSKPDWHYGWLLFHDLINGIEEINSLKTGDKKPYTSKERVL
jgi:TIR domain